MLQAPACDFCVLMESENPLPGLIQGSPGRAGQGRVSAAAQDPPGAQGTVVVRLSHFSMHAQSPHKPHLRQDHPVQDPRQVLDMSLHALVPSSPTGGPRAAGGRSRCPCPRAGCPRGSAGPGPAAVGLSPAGRAAGQASRWLLHPSLRSRRGRRAEREREQEPCPARRHERRQR